jgi:hypothetical protein
VSRVSGLRHPRPRQLTKAFSNHASRLTPPASPRTPRSIRRYPRKKEGALIYHSYKYIQCNTLDLARTSRVALPGRAGLWTRQPDRHRQGASLAAVAPFPGAPPLKRFPPAQDTTAARESTLSQPIGRSDHKPIIRELSTEVIDKDLCVLLDLSRNPHRIATAHHCRQSFSQSQDIERNRRIVHLRKIFSFHENTSIVLVAFQPDRGYNIPARPKSVVSIIRSVRGSNPGRPGYSVVLHNRSCSTRSGVKTVLHFAADRGPAGPRPAAGPLLLFHRRPPPILHRPGVIAVFIIRKDVAAIAPLIPGDDVSQVIP